MEYDGKCFEVEFFDENGDTIDVVTTPIELLALVHTKLLNQLRQDENPVFFVDFDLDFTADFNINVNKLEVVFGKKSKLL